MAQPAAGGTRPGIQSTQRVLDHTPAPEAVQKLFGHAAIQTGDIYSDWDTDQLPATMAAVLADERPRQRVYLGIIPAELQETPVNPQ
jgi:hypothetical protein